MGLMLVPVVLNLCTTAEHISTVVSSTAVKLLLHNVGTEGVMGSAVRSVVSGQDGDEGVQRMVRGHHRGWGGGTDQRVYR